MTLGQQLAIGALWRTRPVRLPDAGPGAGVAAGIAQRYAVDVVAVRVAFVVATVFGGAGAVVYLAAWLLLPAAGDRVSAVEALFGKGDSSVPQNRTVLMLGVLLVALIGLGPLNAVLEGAGLLGIALLLGGWWLLYQRQPGMTARTDTAPAQPDPAWDPLGVPPLAWDLPGISTPRPKSRGTALLLVATMAAAAGMLLLVLTYLF